MQWHPQQSDSAIEPDSSHAGATSSGGSGSEAEYNEQDLDVSEINPFRASKGLEWTDGFEYPNFERIPTSYSSVHEAQNSSYSEGKSQAITVCMADVHPKPISWLWPGRIARGKLTLIAGDPGLGKSLVSITLAAAISKGYKWPLEDSSAPIGSVVFLSAEDDPGDTIRPRLDAAEADCTRIHVLHAVKDVDKDGKPIERMFSLQSDLKILEELLPSIPDCHLLVIDPISAYLDGTDSHSNSEVRGLLAPLAKFAADHNIAVVLVQHLNKSSGGSAMYRAMGSIAFIAAARAGYIVTKDQQNPERRLVMPVKNNLAKDTTGLAYSVVTAENGAPVLVWEKEPITMTADEALSPADSNEEKTNTDWAVEVLEVVLKDGPVPAAIIQKEAKQAGISPKALNRAKEKLGIKPKKADFKGGWVWSLPGYEDAPKDEDTLSGNEGTLDTEGHLRDGGGRREPEMRP